MVKRSRGYFQDYQADTVHRLAPDSKGRARYVLWLRDGGEAIIKVDLERLQHINMLNHHKLTLTAELVYEDGLRVKYRLYAHSLNTLPDAPARMEATMHAIIDDMHALRAATKEQQT